MKKSDLSERVIEYVLTREMDDFELLNVDSVARDFKVNRSYLSKRFKYDRNCSLSEFIIMTKIIRSILLMMKDEEVKVENLSKIMGYSRPNNFIRAFKNKVGTTPLVYKNSLKKLKQSKCW